ncbi:ABC transporter permease [uncultured Imperialibacter sp.]|uniref:ABC transporter permease n=1 Tax=uncultured Imperialibacter sp. TaxID=1672639 RepID=UPI0030D70E41|tara:strand:+ start:12664 stop:15321 length:2658 start_codon:yes stop_codon:yes gene_type:complete
MPNEKVNRWLRFLRLFCPPSLYEGIEGDLLEQFAADVEAFGKRKARRKLTWNVLRFLRPGIILRNSFTIRLINTVVLRNHFIIAYRFLKRNPGHTAINVFGLVIGIASALLILSIIKFEISYDSFHSGADRIYRLVRVSQVEGQDEFRTGVSDPVPVALENEIPGLDHITSMLYWSWGSVQIDVVGPDGSSVRKFKENSGFVIASGSFFDVFDYRDTGFKWLSGDRNTALEEPNAVVLTRSAAAKYFPGQEAVGQTLRINGGDNKVTGVITDLPANTEFPFKVILSYASIRRKGAEFNSNDWVSVSDSHQVYVKLPSQYSKSEFEAQVDKVHAAHVSEEIAAMRKYRLQPMAEVHKDQRFGSFQGRIVSDERLWTLGVVGLFLLLVACINYVNLATAQSSIRAKEVGIRKTLGGARQGLMVQFLCEAFLMALLSSLLALLVAELSVANIQGLLSVKAGGFLFQDLTLMAALLAIILVITLTAGFYPALVISRFSPLAALRSKFSGAGGGFQLRQILTVFQFTVTQVFVIATFVIINQMDFVSSADLGYDKDAIVNINLPGDEATQKLFVSTLADDPAFGSISLSSTVPAGGRRNTSHMDIRRLDWDPSQNLVFEFQWADEKYVDVYGIDIVAGRNFHASDSINRVLINETLANKLGFATPEDAVNQQVVVGNDRGTIVGVVRDFYTQSLRDGMDKVMLAQFPKRYGVASVKLSIKSTETLAAALAKLETNWTNIYPASVFEYDFFDESLASYYEEEKKFSTLFQLFSMVFLAIGCLGLYGLISFVVHKKKKEVAVRKVFGASVASILLLISRDYLKLLGIAFLIAAPTAFYFMQRWLENFTYHTEISWWILVAPGLIVLVVAMLTVSGQSLKAASTNPARVLKDE